jgi:hypothetical protein
MHKFKDPVIKTRAFDHYVNAVQQMRHEVLEKIVAANDEFKEKLTEDEVGDIKGQLDQTYDEIESTFGNEKFIADHYESLKDLQEWRDSRLARRRLERDFFVMLRNLRDFGWNPIDIRGVRSRQLQTFKVIAVSLKPALKAKLGDIEPSESFPYEPDYGAYRTLYAVRINDGLDRKYLKEYVAGGKQNVREALNRSPGTAGVNQYYGKVGVFNHIQEIWDPADHKHEVDTLILKGSADPVSADGQAERLFSEGLEGNKTLIEFGGVGHGFDFPFISITAPFMIGSVRIDPGRVEPGETRTVEGIGADSGVG